MESDHYKNREIDGKFNEMDERLKRFEADTRNWQQRIETEMHTGFETMHRKQDYTNGKVRKVIMAMIALAAFTIGVGVDSGGSMLSLIKCFLVMEN